MLKKGNLFSRANLDNSRAIIPDVGGANASDPCERKSFAESLAGPASSDVKGRAQAMAKGWGRSRGKRSECP